MKQQTTKRTDDIRNAGVTPSPIIPPSVPPVIPSKKAEKQRQKLEKKQTQTHKKQIRMKQKEQKQKNKQSLSEKNEQQKAWNASCFPDGTNIVSNEQERAQLQEFFETLDTHLCALPRKERAEMHGDYREGLRLAQVHGVPVSQAMDALDPAYLGGFYARKSYLWFALDDAAKIYPLSMEHGKMNLFRLSATLKAEVIPACLQLALNLTVCRFPTFAVTLKKGMFWHYLQAAKQRYEIQPDGGMPCRPMEVGQSGAPAFRVFWYRTRISVEFFHILTDGTGGILFLKALLATYLRLCDALAPGHMDAGKVDVPLTDHQWIDTAAGSTENEAHTASKDNTTEDLSAVPVPDAWDTRVTPDPEEFENAFSNMKCTGGAGGFGVRPAVQMNGTLSHSLPCRVLHFHLNTERLKQCAAAHHVTVTAYLLSHIFLSVRAASDALRGECSIQVPVNMRNYLPTKSVRNFSLYCGIRLPMESLRTVDEILPVISAQLREKSAREPMEEMLHATKLLVSTLRFIPLAVKSPIAKVIYGFLGDNGFSTTLSNLGVVELPQSYADKVEHVSFVLGPNPVNRAACAVISFGNTTVLSITKTTPDPSFEEYLCRSLEKAGMEVDVEGTALIH